jgi:histidyl-tRNA synthetase
MSHALDVAGNHNDRVVIDLTIARGLAYYNGPVFETILLNAPQFGSVFSVGRYDDLVMRFLGERVPDRRIDGRRPPARSIEVP